MNLCLLYLELHNYNPDNLSIYRETLKKVPRHELLNQLLGSGLTILRITVISGISGTPPSSIELREIVRTV